jgi:Thymidylate synthase
VLYQRSCDVALGLPFNLWSAALLTRMIAQQVDMLPGELVWMGGDVHLYLNHAHLIDEQLSRQPQGSPRPGNHPPARNNFRTTGSRISWCMITRRCPRSARLLRYRSRGRGALDRPLALK